MLVHKTCLEALLFGIQPLVAVVAEILLLAQAVNFSVLVLNLLLESLQILLILLLGFKGTERVASTWSCSTTSGKCASFWSLEHIIWKWLDFASFDDLNAELLDVNPSLIGLLGWGSCC